MKEIWKDINGYEADYQVSNLGRIKSFKRNGCMFLAINDKCKDGYKRITLRKPGSCKSWMVHRLIAEAFVDNPNDKPEVNHLNSDRADNRIDNLEWVTRCENNEHAVKFGRRDYKSVQGEKQWKAKLTSHKVKRIRLMYEITPTLKHREIAAMFGVCSRTIFRILNRYSWKHI